MSTADEGSSRKSAMDWARAAMSEIEGHEKICAVRYEAIGKDIADINRKLSGVGRWLAGVGSSLLVALVVGGVTLIWALVTHPAPPSLAAENAAQASQIAFLRGQVTMLGGRPGPPIVVNTPPPAASASRPDPFTGSIDATPN